MSGFVRKSKFRHVFGQPAKKDQCYENFRVTNCAFEGNFIAANGKFVAFCVETGGSGTFIVLPVGKQTGRLDPNIPKVTAAKEYLLDMKWNPYNDNMLATCSEDGSIRLWNIPDNGFVTNQEYQEPTTSESLLLTLDYHEKRCVQLSWHPIVSNVMLSVSQESKICIWNLDDGECEVDIDIPNTVVWNAEWSQKGDKIVSSSKDKKFRIHDARSGKLLVEGQGHEGSKAQRVIFTMNDKFLFSCGFSKMSERQYAVWNAETLEELNLEELDTANGCLIPYYDPDTEIVYIAAKGDSVIRYYELVDEEPYFHYITTYQSSVAQRGLASIPKRDMVVNDCEVYRFYKLAQTGTVGSVTPVNFCVPRKSDLFQDDLYPDTIGDEPALQPDEWFAGKDAEPIRIQMKNKFVGKAPKASGGLSGGGGLKKGGLKKKTADAGEKPKKTAEPAKEEPKKELEQLRQSKEEKKEPEPEPKKPEPKPEPKREPEKVEEPQEKQKKVSDLIKEKDEKKSAAKSQPVSEGVNKQEIKELKAIVDDLAKLDEKRSAKMKELERRLAALEAK